MWIKLSILSLNSLMNLCRIEG
ncbi:hypothetical protein MED222_05175 [Vibrio sp. MED222]|nr:hypothetical protein MED222_05175 [Vibrio sp. MED222]